ncbi:hypothetical protein EJ05DRAFT_536898 [Pseudovirgaria hyperparasitica]|uniref:MHYT domain-containing protein n=1 Tax=Pseudovirgaria hyperparasitica TaxID=470096 RepID=A0A6A6W9S0_9PEZI|nr:uncharacterized protein EJ05DRAFT_536898 [Pseudovirgaria hyperparasitica]KAF2759618.1 hypothetical protein EJ05DRAFT_536898 [Pseudovirgaria hyperparasitica]
MEHMRESLDDTLDGPVPYHFVWWIIMLSYFVSLVGSVTTVEFLHRRRVGQGLISQLQLGACAVSFGLVAIWCMHFVGNRSIVLANGEPELQLYYNAAWTTLSAVLPIFFLYVGFFLVDRFSRSQRAMHLSLIGTGLTAGLSITGMHYVGNLGATNYRLSNKPGHIIGAASIAVVSCWVSFTIFFRQKELWINSWYRRVMCAVLLACTVSGMHWTATAGTTYYRIRTYAGTEEERNRNVIVATALCMTALLCSVTLMYVTERRRRELADRAQHVVLASFIVDRDGRVLVTQEGLLPCRMITKQYNQRSLNDEFNIAHPVFQWIYRVTHHWSGVAILIPTMRSHLRAVGALQGSIRPGALRTATTSWDGATAEDDYSAIFREQFCVAAQDLADNLHVPLDSLGTLMDDIMMTGIGSKKFKTKGGNVMSALEAGMYAPALFGKGQILFLVKQVNKIEAVRLVDQGYRFAHIERPTDKVLELMARGMQVKREDLLLKITCMKEFGLQDAEKMKSPLESGTHISCFVLRPPVKSSASGWDVLVRKTCPNTLPSVELYSTTLPPSRVQLLERLDGFNYTQCLNYCDKMTNDATTSEDREFHRLVWKTMVHLEKLLPAAFLRCALFCGTPVNVQNCSASKGATLFSFCVIPDVHSSSLSAEDVVNWTPFSFFRCRQRTHKGSVDHILLARRNHIEFGALLANIGVNQLQYHSNTVHKPSINDVTRNAAAKPLSKLLERLGGGNKDLTPVHFVTDSSSEKGLVDRVSREEPSCNPFGGIMVSQDITVDTDDKAAPGIELHDLGMRTEAGVADSETSTYVDQLFRLTSAKWSKP